MKIRLYVRGEWFYWRCGHCGTNEWTYAWNEAWHTIDKHVRYHQRYTKIG